MTLQEALKVKESLQELEATAEKFNWGPSQAFAQQRQKEAIRIVEKEIKFLQNKAAERTEANERRAEARVIRSKLGYSRIGRNNV
jgi:hypothetical protein